MKERNWTVIETLRHARHDWINDLQLVKGYLSLSNLEEAARAADHMIVKAVQESRLCNLGMPGMAEQLITFNWSQRAFQLEYEVEENMPACSGKDEAVSGFFKQLFTVLEQHVHTYSGHDLFICFREKEKRLWLQMEWTGETGDPLLALNQLQQLQAATAGDIQAYSDSGMIRIEATF